jgi:hypothetical protein
MKRISLALASLAIAMACWALPAQGQVPTGDSVVGIGMTAPSPDPFAFTWEFNIEASSGPSGEAPSGFVQLFVTSPQIPGTGIFGGPVTCLSVSGNEATVVVANQPGPPGILLLVEDNGPPGSDPSDTVAVEPVNDPTSCALPAVVTPLEVVEGDVTVTDASALPTSKDQCKNGGWRNYPQFANQGQCITFVQHGPDP